MKALDIVKTPNGSIAYVTETHHNGTQVSINFIHTLRKGNDFNAWWDSSVLEVIDSIPSMLARSMFHPFGNGEKDATEFFKINQE